MDTREYQLRALARLSQMFQPGRLGSLPTEAELDEVSAAMLAASERNECPLFDREVLPEREYRESYGGGPHDSIPKD